MDRDAGAAAVMNAAYFVRMYGRPGQERQRARALQRMAELAIAELRAGRSPEPILYAIACGLYDRKDPRFS